MNLKSYLFAAMSFFAVSFPVHAGPNQIDVVGLIPGVSTVADVKIKMGIRVTGLPRNNKLRGRLVIGGYIVGCIAEFERQLLLLAESPLRSLVCDTESPGVDVASSESVSGAEIHGTLVKGYTEKFGTPSDVFHSFFTLPSASLYELNGARWTDGKNELLLLTIDNWEYPDSFGHDLEGRSSSLSLRADQYSNKLERGREKADEAHREY